LVTTLTGNERIVMESLWRHMERDYKRPLGGELLLAWTGLDETALAEAVRRLAARPHPYVEVSFHPDRPDRVVELRLTVDGQAYCRARD
jgi:DNA-binding MarR family transcriptional regulator